MRRPFYLLLSVTLLLGACQLPSGTTAIASKGKKAMATPSARPSAAASTAARASARPSPSPSPVIDGQLLTGLLKMDASFVVAAGGGNVVAAGGGNVIAAGGGNLIQVGGQVIAAGGGNVIAAGGGNVIAAGGGNVIAAGGGNVIAAGGGNYRVAEAAPAPALGEMLPASGMAVVAVSLRTGKPVSEAVLTDAQGHYSLHVAKSETGNVRVVAAVPGKTETDPVLTDTKFQSELLAAANSTEELVLDDDRTLVSRYFPTAFVSRLDDLLANDTLGPASSSGNPLVDTLWAEMRKAATDSGARTLADAPRKALAARMAGALISYVDLKSARSDQNWRGWVDKKDELAFDGYTAVLKACREATQAKLREKATFFDGLSVLKPGATIRYPRDMGAYMFAEFFSKDADETNISPLFSVLGIDDQQAFRVKAAENGLKLAIGFTLISNPEAKKALIALMNEAGGKQTP